MILLSMYHGIQYQTVTYITLFTQPPRRQKISINVEKCGYPFFWGGAIKYADLPFYQEFQE